MAPRFSIIDFGPGGSLPTLGDNEPLQHFEHGLTLTGRRLTLDGQSYDVGAGPVSRSVSLSTWPTARK
jgi:hypothetical protein